MPPDMLTESRFRFYLYAIAEQFVDNFVVGIEAFVVVAGSKTDFVQGFVDEGRMVSFIIFQ